MIYYNYGIGIIYYNILFVFFNICQVAITILRVFIIGNELRDPW